MRILDVDIGTGTEDIFLFDSRLDIENGYKMVVPSPTLMINRRIEQATREKSAILLHGQTMGGGPSQWAAENHLRTGLPVYATPDAARTFNDDLTAVREMGIVVISDDEASRLPASVCRIELRDFDFENIRQAFDRFGVSIDHLDAVAVAVFDHGAAPPRVSDRQFRFDYLDERIRTKNRLSAFAYLPGDIPPSMTRLKSVADAARGIDAEVVVMDTAAAAVLGATCDPNVRQCERGIVANIGNLHTLAFRLGPMGIEGVFEHHTGLLNREKFERIISRFASGELSREEVFNDHGHGALVYAPSPLHPEQFKGFAVTGPRRGLIQGSSLDPYFAVPFGDMMLAGCFGLLAAAGELIPAFSQEIADTLSGKKNRGNAPWDIR